MALQPSRMFLDKTRTASFGLNREESYNTMPKIIVRETFIDEPHHWHIKYPIKEDIEDSILSF